MKQENDVQLISKILEGDDTAFSTLVEKYQKGIHALVWRKIGDFHYAEEIMQDTFLKAYKNLSTLREPSQFAGWLYVIANRLCIKRSPQGLSQSGVNPSSHPSLLLRPTAITLSLSPDMRLICHLYQ